MSKESGFDFVFFLPRIGRPPAPPEAEEDRLVLQGRLAGTWVRILGVEHLGRGLHPWPKPIVLNLVRPKHYGASARGDRVQLILVRGGRILQAAQCQYFSVGMEGGSTTSCFFLCGAPL